ncbi:MAG: VCBS repeat-containing protein, partial [Verrucomicrobia bacterium]|nr:VCBS repeat-containing protein [Verrucomicrobiota bacterium]
MSRFPSTVAGRVAPKPGLCQGRAEQNHHPMTAEGPRRPAAGDAWPSGARCPNRPSTAANPRHTVRQPNRFGPPEGKQAITTTRSVFLLLCLAAAAWLVGFAGTVGAAEDIFVRANESAFTNNPTGSAGCAWGDYDNDGWTDLFTANWTSGNNDLYHNAGQGTFTKITDSLVGGEGGASIAAAWGDYDNDGFLDLFVVNYNQPSFLYRNNGDGTFLKITDTVLTTAGPSQSCAWGDYDNDGFVDLVVANRRQPAFLYRNNGDGTFSSAGSSAAGRIVQDSGDSRGCAWGDYDNDGYLDLVVANAAGPSFLFHNNGDGTFTRMADLAPGHGCAWGDYNNDGYQDLCLANADGGFNVLYHNNADGTFTERAGMANGYGLSCAWADYDNDGWLDLFLTRPDDRRNLLYRNNGGGGFTWITTSIAVTDGGNFYGCGWDDIDHDGYLDLFVANNWTGQPNRLYRNRGGTNSWITVKPSRRGANHAAV